MQRYMFRILTRLLLAAGPFALLLPASSYGAAGLRASGEHVHYQLAVGLEPGSQRLEVEGVLQLPERNAAAGSRFWLNEKLVIVDSQPPVKASGERDGHLASYTLVEAAPDGRLALNYMGSLSYELSGQRAEYTRGFRETLGILGEEGVYFSGSSAWVPKFDGDLITFEIDVHSVPGWHVISQGNGTSGDGDGRAHWNSGGPLEQIYLVGGPLKRWSDNAGAIETLVYLHADEEPVAAKYLEATSRYIEMYRKLLGPYPYEKFALVENFWETGYGMPSFTLLGEQIIRFPFILHSSYPHEILHNWWGNSVFVDYATGNWCEGLTAYMADHLIQEQRGGGALYRRSTLQKYRDYVKEGRDFPLEQFSSRHDAATEAIGYGKSLMGFHALRRQLGDEVFVQGLADFYKDNRGRHAGFADLALAFEGRLDRAQQAEAGELELGDFFKQWLKREGAPKLEILQREFSAQADGYEISVELAQVQPGEPFAIRVPLRVTSAEGVESFVFQMRSKTETFQASVSSEPWSVEIDPDFDVFRLLDPRETPSSIGQIFGEPEILALLPSAASPEDQGRYRELVNYWNTEEHKIEVRLDSSVDSLPPNRALWVFGANNLHRAVFEGWRADALALDRGGNSLLTSSGDVFPGHCSVVLRRHPANMEKAVGWIVVDPWVALEGLARKLPHYGKYSYLAFQGSEPTNVLKGQWSTPDSPLSATFAGTAGEKLVVASTPSERQALAELAPVFAQAALRKHVEWLAHPEREGRVPGSAGHEASAEHIAEAFKNMGLEPAMPAGSWFQEFVVPAGPDGKSVRVRNVIGLLRGTREDWKQQSVVLSAHYDHLGRGWPDAHKDDRGKLHLGANDNASGVSVMLELAANLAAAGQPSRNLLVVAFSAEECGLLGSKHYVDNPVLPLEGIRGVINLDTVGSLGQAPLAIHGTGTADEWQHIFRGCGFVTGIASKNVPEGAEGSDQWSFIQKGVPAVQIVTGAGLHYHRSTDTVEHVDFAGLVQVATFLKEAVVYMVERPEPMKVTIDGVQAAAPPTTNVRRGVSFGSIPEYGFSGEGMLLGGVSPGSPAEKAGLLAGDVLIQIDDQVIAKTRDFANVLKTLTGGQTVQATVLRGGKKATFAVTVIER